MGLDDVRRYSWLREEPLPIYASDSVIDRLNVLYPYASPKKSKGKAVPLINMIPWKAKQKVGTMVFTPFSVPHGGIPCIGIRIDGPTGSIGYVPDCSGLPPKPWKSLKVSIG
jgi:phosphoribosyl 1,2-cyclic phosphodiesterase